jgi:hypothetical protein
MGKLCYFLSCRFGSVIVTTILQYGVLTSVVDIVFLLETDSPVLFIFIMVFDHNHVRHLQLPGSTTVTWYWLPPVLGRSRTTPGLSSFALTDFHFNQATCRIGVSDYDYEVCPFFG